MNAIFYRRLSFVTAVLNSREMSMILVNHVTMVRLTMCGHQLDHAILDSQTSNIVSYHSMSMIILKNANILGYFIAIFVYMLEYQ